MPAKLILNPYANRWTALKRKDEAMQALHVAGVDFDLVITDRPNQAIELAEQAVRQGYSPIIAAGGDGSISEVVNGMLLASGEEVVGPLGVLPLGTANDLVVNLGLPLDLPGAARCIAAGKTRRIDLGKVNEWAFDNNSAVGLEPVVSIYNARMVWLRGVVRYVVAALRAIGKKPEWHMALEWDDGSYEGPVSLVSVGNCPVTGGVFRIAPGADPADGLLTFVFGYVSTRRRMLALLPKIIKGEHINDPAMHQINTRRLSIRTATPSPLQVDGEVRAEAASEFAYECLPARLDILTP